MTNTDIGGMSMAEMFAIDATEPPSAAKAYEKMYDSLFAYRFGTIGFLDLLLRFEEVLGITQSQSDNHADCDTKEQ